MTTPRLLFILTVTQQGVVFGNKQPEQPAQFLDSFLGCYNDKSDRDLPHKLGKNKNIEQCRTLANTKKMKYFGMQNGDECWAGNSYGKHGAIGSDSNCAKNSKKMNSNSEERMQLDGQAWRNAIYRTQKQWFTANKKNKMFRNGTFIGCYWDDVNRAFEDEFEVKKKKQTMTRVDSVQECGKLAEKNNMPYFAVQGGSECRMSKKLFPHRFNWYPPTYGNSLCARIIPKKISKHWGNYAGNLWMDAIYYTKPSPYWPGAFLDAPEGDDTIRLAWANAYCLNVYGGKLKEGAEIAAFWCVNQKGKTTDTMKFDVKDGLIKCKTKPTMCIGLTGKALVTSKTLTLAKC